MAKTRSSPKRMKSNNALPTPASVEPVSWPADEQVQNSTNDDICLETIEQILPGQELSARYLQLLLGTVRIVMDNKNLPISKLSGKR